MSILKSSDVTQLKDQVKAWRSKGRSIGFVPTMGALHQGHLSLIAKAQEECDHVVCSIFVNPTQFNDARDFERYPRTIEQDVKMLADQGCDLVFTPSPSDIYPNGTEFHDILPMHGLDEVMEGAHRPGHFRGVVQVVKRLFELVEPDKAYFGLKDYQQYSIVKWLTRHYQLPVKIVGVETIREENGLAMSSRNRLLTEEDKELAPLLHEVLKESAERYRCGEEVAHIRILAEQRLTQIPGLKLDYFELADADTLQPVHQSGHASVRAFVAAFMGAIRLIDNVAVN